MNQRFLSKQSQGGPWRALPVFFAVFGIIGCGPIVFEDQSAITVPGEAPEAPKPVVKETPKRVEVRDNRIEIREKIQFDVNKATIRSESFSLMDEIAETIRKHPHIKKISIEGHASSEGSDTHNLRLSDKRAKAVMEYLVQKSGIAKEMFTAKGYGETKPISDNETEEGREKNRRVEFLIVEQEVTHTKYEVDPETGKRTVLEKKTDKVTN